MTNPIIEAALDAVMDQMAEMGDGAALLVVDGTLYMLTSVDGNVMALPLDMDDVRELMAGMDEFQKSKLN